MPNALIEVWQANAAGRYRHDVDQHPAPLDPNFTGAGRTLTDADGAYRFVTIKPGAYPVAEPSQRLAARRTSTSRSSDARSSQRLVTQMYFPGDPLFAFDPIFNSVRDPSARERLVAPLRPRDDGAGVGARLPLRHRPAADAVRGMRTPSQTVGPYFTLGLCRRPQNELPEGTVELRGRVLDGEGAAVADALVEVWDPAAGLRPLRHRRRRRVPLPRPAGRRAGSR